jgi:hypothetical protein
MNIHLISFLDKDHSQPHKLFTLCFFIGTRPLEGGQGGGYCLLVSKSNFNIQAFDPSTVVFVCRAESKEVVERSRDTEFPQKKSLRNAKGF